jgi:drug/metabolite transporter (DMT)-like permease
MPDCNRQIVHSAAPPRVDLKPYLALLTVYIVWGTTMGFIRYGVTTVEPSVFVVTRFLLSGLLMVGWCLLRGQQLPTSWRDWGIHLMLAVVMYCLGHAVNYWTLQHVPAGLGGMVSATNPFWMLLLTSWLPPRERIPGQAYGALLLGFLGMVILLLPQWTHLQNFPPVYWASLGINLVGTVFWSFGSILARKLQPGQSLVMSVGLQNLLGSVVLMPTLLTANLHHVGWTPETWWALAYLVLLGTVLTTTCYLFVLKNLSVPQASTVAYVTPIVTLFFGHWFLGEALTPVMLLGAAVILMGVFWIQRLSHQIALPEEACPPACRAETESAAP